MIHNTFRRSIVICFVLCLMFITLTQKTVFAETPYKTYTIDGNGNVMETQTAYTPYQTIIKIDDEITVIREGALKIKL